MVGALGGITSGLLLKLGLISGGTGIVGNLLSSVMGNRRDLRMWRMTNAYNSPEQQMARLKKAGLNPALVYGSSSVVGNSQSQRPTTNIPDISSSIPNLPQLYETATSIENKRAQTQLIEENERLAEENQKLIKAKLITEGSRAFNLDRNSENLFTKTQQLRGLYPYNLEIKKLQAKKIFPELVKKYGLQNADLAWKVNEMNPISLERNKQDIAERLERIASLAYANKINSQMSGYNATYKDHLLYRMLVGALYENGLGKTIKP